MALVDEVGSAIFDCNKNSDIVAALSPSQQINLPGNIQGVMDQSAPVQINSNISTTAVLLQHSTDQHQHLQQQQQQHCASLTERTGYRYNNMTSLPSLSPDDTLNNDFYYDDEFSVPFDANITNYIDVDQPLSGSLMVQSLTDSAGRTCNRLRRWMTTSRSDSCLYRPEVDGQPRYGSDGEEMSTSERQEDLNSSSDDDLSDLQTSHDRPLFTPPPSAEPYNGEQILSRSEVNGAVTAESLLLSNNSARFCATGVYDFSAAKHQYVISFDQHGVGGIGTSKTSSNGEEFFRPPTSVLDHSANSREVVKRSSVTVGCNGGGLTTWKQVQRTGSQNSSGSQAADPSLTTWTRLKAMRSSKTPNSLSITPSSPHRDVVTATSISASHSRQLLKQYCLNRSSTVTAPQDHSQVAAFQRDCSPTVCQTSYVVSSKKSNDATAVRSHDKVSSRSRSLVVIDRSVQCLPSSVDRGVQTGLVPGESTSIGRVRQVDKSLQTSTQVNGQQHMVRSAILLSRPLPDLQFLYPASKNASTSKSNQSRSGELAVKRPGTDGTVEVERRQGRCVRRHHSSDSAFSNNSSSSSGIEPGYSDSGTTGDSCSSVPRKPPRLFSRSVTPQPQTVDDDDKNDPTTPPAGDNAVVLRRTATLDRASRNQRAQPIYSCAFVTQPTQTSTSPTGPQGQGQGHADGTVGSPTSNKDSVTEKLPTRLSSPRRTRRRDVVHLDNKPAKSILRRQQRNRNDLTADINDSDERPDHSSICCHDNIPLPPATTEAEVGNEKPSHPALALCGVRPVSLPDATVLYKQLTVFQPAACNNPTVDTVLACQCPGGRMKTAEQSVDVVDGITVNCDDLDDPTAEQFRAKKSVSFSEKIFYHSMPPSVSPIESPLCQTRPMLATSGGSEDKTVNAQAVLQEQRDTTPTNDVPCAASIAAAAATAADALVDYKVKDVDGDEDENDMPPTDFTVSPQTLSPVTSLVTSAGDSVDITHKKDLVVEVQNAVDALVKCYSQQRQQDASIKLRVLTMSELDEEIHRVVIDQFCPALHAVVLDGLKPYVRSFFGRMKNSAWKVVEDSVELGEPVDLLHDLLNTVRHLENLRTPWLLFNAFIIALLNNKALDFWLTHLCGNKLLMLQHYNSAAFLLLSGSAVTAHRLFMDLVTAIQPLAQLSFSLEYDYELRRLERLRRRQQQSITDSTGSAENNSYQQHQQQRQFRHQVSLETVRRPSTLLSRDASNVELSQTLRGVFSRLGNRASQSLVLARNALQNTSTLATVSRPRPLSMPVNLLDDVNTISSGTSGGDINFESSSGDSVDSVGFFRRFTGQFWTPSAADQPRVYKKGVTDYSFRQSPEYENEPTTPVCSGSPVAADCSELEQRPVTFTCGPTASSEQSNSLSEPVANQLWTIPKASGSNPLAAVDSNNSKLNKNRMTPRPASSYSSSMVVGAVTNSKPPTGRYGSGTIQSQRNSDTSLQLRVNTPSTSDGSVTSQPATSSKRWSDFGLRLVGFVDKMLLPEEQQQQQQRKVPRVTTEKQPMISARDCRSDIVSSSTPSFAAVNQLESDNNKPGRLQRCDVSMQLNIFNSVGGTIAAQRSAEIERKQSDRYVLALCHCIASDNDQLSFHKGMQLIVVKETPGSDWLLCRHGDREGLVHRACVKSLDS